MRLFSVLVPVYKNDVLEQFKIAIRSISEDQTCKPSQIVITVDGPLPLEIKEYVLQLEKNELFTVVWSKVNNGLGIALNLGLDQCKYDIVARMDSDDVSFPDRFERQLKLMDKNDLVSASLAEFSTSTGEIESIRRATNRKRIPQVYWLRNPFNHPSVMFRKSEVLKAGGYLDMPYFEDWYLWVRMINHGARCDNLNEPLVYFRSDKNQLNRRRGINYLKFEIHFVNTLKSRKFISNLQFYTRITLSTIFRFLPMGIFKLMTKLVLRK